MHSWAGQICSIIIIVYFKLFNGVAQSYNCIQTDMAVLPYSENIVNTKYILIRHNNCISNFHQNLNELTNASFIVR